MERAERLDFDGVKGVRKPRTFSVRKPRSGGSHATFLNEYEHSSPSDSPPSDPRSAGNADKGLNEEPGKYSNSHSHGDDYKRRLGSSNSKGKFEMGRDDLGKSNKSASHRRAGGDDDWVPERDEMKRVRRDAADHNGKHSGRSPDNDRNHDRKYDRGGSKPQEYERSKRPEKSFREKNHRDGFHYERDSKEYSTGEKAEKERGRFGETFKRKRHCDDLDRSKRFRDGGMDRKDSYERNGSHDRLDRDRERDRDRNRDRDVQGNVKSSEGGQGPSHVHKSLIGGLGAGGSSGDWRNSDGHKVPERRSSDSHNLSQLKGGTDSGHSRMTDGGRRAEGRIMDSRHAGQSKSASEGQNGGQVKTLVDGRTSHNRDSDMKSLDKSVLRQDDPPSQEGRLTKVKLKVGGVTHTIHANSTGNPGGTKQKGLEASSASGKPPQATEGGRRRQRLILQENSDDEDDFPARVEIQESPKKELQFYTNASIAKMDTHHAKEITSGKQAEMTNNVVAGQPVRKSTRIPKKRILDGEHDEDDDGEEASQRKISRNTKKRVPVGEYEEDEEGHETSQRRSLRMPKKRVVDAEYDEDDEEDEMQQHKRRLKRSKYERDSEDLYQEDDEEEAASADEDAEIIVDAELEGKKKRNRRKQEVGNSTFDDKKEAPLTARQRAMQSCKDVDSEVGANLIEFPEGLPQTSQRKRKEKLSEVEQQLKKAEAAQRRKMQVEKAANEIQAEAIKKILGQDSLRKKREDKLRKQRDEMAQEKAASAMMLASNSVRWVMGPSGTVVSFSENTGLPSIFNSGPCRYPPPREKCAGPLCNNTYKYRDSKSKLPLCSLQCYRAIHDVTHTVSTC